jgi:hypothetical protein
MEAALGSDRPAQRHAAITALRRFYRLGSTRKQQHIEALA